MPDTLLDKILEWIFGGFIVAMFLVWGTAMLVGLIREMFFDD